MHFNCLCCFNKACRARSNKADLHLLSTHMHNGGICFLSALTICDIKYRLCLPTIFVEVTQRVPPQQTRSCKQVMDVTSDYKPTLCPFNPGHMWTCPGKSFLHFCHRALKSFHLIVWWNTNLQRAHINSIRGEKSGLRKWKETSSYKENVFLHECHTHCVAYSTTCSVTEAQKEHLSKMLRQIWSLKELNLISLTEHNLITQRQR